MAYLSVKTVHVTCVVISVSLFLLRGALQGMGRPWRSSRVLLIAPHVVDTLLLASALWLCWIIGQYPFVQGWLTAKVLALVLYIYLGRIALGRNTPAARRLPAFVLALICVGYIVGVAVTHSPTWGRF